MAKISNEIVAPKRVRKNNSRPTLDGNIRMMIERREIGTSVKE